MQRAERGRGEGEMGSGAGVGVVVRVCAMSRRAGLGSSLLAAAQARCAAKRKGAWGYVGRCRGWGVGPC